MQLKCLECYGTGIFHGEYRSATCAVCEGSGTRETHLKDLDHDDTVGGRKLPTTPCDARTDVVGVVVHE